jgi:hypothetical protein
MHYLPSEGPACVVPDADGFLLAEHKYYRVNWQKKTCNVLMLCLAASAERLVLC